MLFSYVGNPAKGTNMWTRAELKSRGKSALKRNYWKAVLVGVLLAIVVGTTGAIGDDSSGGMVTGTTVGIAALNTVDDDQETYVESYDEPEENRELDDTSADDLAFFVPVFLIVTLGVVVVIGLAVGVSVFLELPLEVGCRRFFLLNLNRRADVREVAWAFDNSYLNVVKILFVRDLKLLGWSLLLVIPGIYKSYEYRMIPYLLAEDPTMNMDEAFAQSRLLMDGQKWNAFVLDLSFLGWHALSALTCGIVGAFYAWPYVDGTNAALYETLRYGGDKPEEALPLPAAPITPAPPEDYDAGTDSDKDATI